MSGGALTIVAGGRGAGADMTVLVNGWQRVERRHDYFVVVVITIALVADETFGCPSNGTLTAGTVELADCS